MFGLEAIHDMIHAVDVVILNFLRFVGFAFEDLACLSPVQAFTEGTETIPCPRHPSDTSLEYVGCRLSRLNKDTTIKQDFQSCR